VRSKKKKSQFSTRNKSIKRLQNGISCVKNKQKLHQRQIDAKLKIINSKKKQKPIY